MNLILSTTFQSLPPAIQQPLLKQSISFYYPDQEEMILSDREMRKRVEETLRKVERLKSGEGTESINT